MDYDDNVFKEAVNDSVDVVGLADVPNQYVLEETILFIFALMGIAANILLIYICCYFRKLHTNTNIYLINWAIADCGSALITMTFFKMFYFEIPYAIVCFYVGLAFALIFNEMLFMIMLTVDWCLSAYLPRPLEKFRKQTKIIVAVLWILAAIYSFASSFLCTSASTYYLIFHISLPLVYVSLLLFVIVLHCIRMVQKLRHKYEYHPIVMLILPTAFVLCDLLSWANLLFLDVDGIYIVTETPVFLQPTINLLLLILLDSDFKVCFLQVVKCKRYPTCNLFKPTIENVERNGSSNSGDQPIAFDNKTFESMNANRHI